MTAFPASTWTRPPRQRTGVLGLGILAIAVSTWLLAPQTLAAIGLVATPDLGVVAEAAISAAVPASLVLALGAVASRVAWLLVLAIPVLALHGLMLVVVAIVVGADGAPGVVVLGHLGDAVATGLALAAVIVALVATAAARAGARREGTAWIGAVVVAAIAGAIVVATPYVRSPDGDALALLLSDTLVVAPLLVVAGVAGVRHAAARWVAAGLAVAVATWIVMLETVVLPWGTAGTIAIAIVRALLLLLAGALVALSTRWLEGPQGVAPPVVPTHPSHPAAPQVAPPVVPAAPVTPPVANGPIAGAAARASTTAAETRVEPSTHAPGVPEDADAAIDQSDQEVPTDASAPSGHEHPVDDHGDGPARR